MRRDDGILLDILIAARRARQYVSGMTREEFDQSPLHQDAVEGRLIAIGSLTRRLSPFLRESHPEIPWRELTAIGNNRLVTEYFRLDVGAVWNTVLTELPPVVALIEALIPPEKESPT
jgi:uncharacterized protein with HEPN domain